MQLRVGLPNATTRRGNLGKASADSPQGSQDMEDRKVRHDRSPMADIASVEKLGNTRSIRQGVFRGVGW